jgi:transcriptional regulator with GAF, ATPase, and Fis domain
MRPPVFADDDRFLLAFLPGSSQAMRQLRLAINRLNRNVGLVGFVLLSGETGSGKNHVARVTAGHRQWLTIQMESDKLDPGRTYPGGLAPLDVYTERMGDVPVSVVTESLAASELFGHVRGAFSDAKKDHPGLFGDDGYDDILLDEIGEAPAWLQAKLLGVLEGRAFIPVGGTSKQKQSIKSRVLMATNRDIPRMVREGNFREDLWFRIRRHIINIPPLRDHIDDLPMIASAIIERLYSRVADRRSRALPNLTSKDLEWCRLQPWKGNVREVEEVLEQWLVSGTSDPIETIASKRVYTDSPASSPVPELATRVRQEIDDILAGRKTSPGTFSNFVGVYTNEVKDHVRTVFLDWYRDRRPDAATMQCLFPRMSWASIKTVLSRSGRQ